MPENYKIYIPLFKAVLAYLFIFFIIKLSWEYYLIFYTFLWLVLGFIQFYIYDNYSQFKKWVFKGFKNINIFYLILDYSSVFLLIFYYIFFIIHLNKNWFSIWITIWILIFSLFLRHSIEELAKQIRINKI